MFKSWMVQQGIWSPRDKEYVWKDYTAYETSGDARYAARKFTAWRILETSVFAVHAPEPVELDKPSSVP